MLTTMFQSRRAPQQPRWYLGRHRMPSPFRFRRPVQVLRIGRTAVGPVAD